MTVTDRGFESFLQDRENIAHIAGSKFIFLGAGQEWKRRYDSYHMSIFSLGTCVYDCEKYEMVSESSSNQEIHHVKFCSIWCIQVYGRWN